MDITILGRIALTKMDGLSRLIYVVCSLPLPSDIIRTINKIYLNFIWKNKCLLIFFSRYDFNYYCTSHCQIFTNRFCFLGNSCTNIISHHIILQCGKQLYLVEQKIYNFRELVFEHYLGYIHFMDDYSDILSFNGFCLKFNLFFMSRFTISR